MRLMHLAAYGGAYPGSFIPMIRSILASARDRGWRVDAVFSDAAADRAWLEQLLNSGVDCHFTPDGHRDRMRAVNELVAGDEPLILHTHFASFDVAAVAAVRKRPNAIVYWHKHGGLRADTRTQLRNTVKFGVFGRSVEQILCVAPNVVQDAQRCLAPRDRLVLLPNAIDLEKFPLVSASQRHSAREMLDLPLDAPIVLHFGWDWRRKGGDVFLSTIADLLRQDEMKDLVALTVADARATRPAIESLGIADHVRVLPPTDDVQTLYAAADIFAAPSRSEGHPFAVAEALASGLPVIASPIPGHDMVAQLTKMCQIAKLDAPSFSDAIAATLGQPASDRDAPRSAGREEIVKEMDIGAWSERMLTRYESALARRSLL